MTITSTAGIAASWTAARQDAGRQAMEIAMVKSQADAERAVAEMVDETARAGREASPPPPPGQGRYVDVRA